MLTREQLLPDRIPPGLDVGRCYRLGLRYRLAGQISRAKEALTLVTELDADSDFAKKAQTILKTQLPVGDVPDGAEQRNIEAYNLMDSNPKQAKEIFLDLMNRYPDFEWPFSNYAWMLVSEGDLPKAKSLAKYLLTLNPNHLRSIHLSMQIALMEGNMTEALVFAERGQDACEGDTDFKELVQAIILHKKGEPPQTLPHNLEPGEYLDLAKRYEMFGRLNLAQKAADLAVAKDGNNGEVSRKAIKFMKRHLPHLPVSEEAEQRLTAACNLKADSPEQSKQALEQLLSDFPQFENPAIILASFHFQDRDLQNAEKFTTMALNINPQSEPAKIFLLQLCMMQEQFEQALQFMESELVEPDQLTISLDLMRAQCELAIYHKQRQLHR